MLKNIPTSHLLFLDIETVPQHENWDDVSPSMQFLFEKKTSYQREKKELSVEEFYHQQAGIWAEFGKIVCISCGYIFNDDQIKIKSFYGDDEKEVLLKFKELLLSHYNHEKALLCAHNGKEFDFPFLARRMIIHQIELPPILQLHGKKPWEIQHLDTLELWKFGDFKHYTSLDLLAEILGIPTPKDDICGSDVRDVYYNDKNLSRIVNYCEKDVLTLAQIFRKFRFESTLKRVE